MTVKTIKVDYLARVEGEGAIKVVVRDGAVESTEFRIFEPPRFFEALLRGRAFTEAPDITARIWNRPVAYQMSTVHAMENALGLAVTGPLRDLRRLLYCGEWIESHALHIYMLHAPDFLGYDGAIDMARDHGDAVRRGLALKKVGNEILSLLGGREIHPINVRVGGFYRTPRRRELDPLAERLKWAREAALETVRWVAAFDFPDVERDYEFVALRHADEYPFNEGRIISSRGLELRLANTKTTSKKPMSSVRQRCIRTCANGAHISSDPLPATASTSIACRGSPKKSHVTWGWGRNAAIPIAASSSVLLRSYMHATRHSGSSTATWNRTFQQLRPSRVPARAMLRPRRRAACSITGIVWTRMEPSLKLASCRRPRKTRQASRRIS